MQPDRTEEVKKWEQEYIRVSGTPPIAQIIRTEDGEDIKVEVNLEPDQEPFIFTRIYVPTRVCGPTDWYAQSVAQVKTFGFKVILMRKSRNALIQKYGLEKKVLRVKSIKITQQTKSGKAYLADVEEFCSDET